MKSLTVRLPRRRWLRVALIACAILAVLFCTWSVELQRGPCAGLCPAYTVKVWGNGLVQYHGDLALITGDRLNYIGPIRAQQLIVSFLIFGFPFNEDVHPSGNIDFPGVSTCLTIILFRKCVSNSFGLIDDYTHSTQWIGTQEQLLEKYIHPQRP